METAKKEKLTTAIKIKELVGFKPKDVNDLMKFLDMKSRIKDDGAVEGLTDQLTALQKFGPIYLIVD